ncbi:BafA family autotransporter [Bartonella tribocorum]|uniref:Autotransporter outer membrane beta-barrel domain-containing protein n=1 Tax=Bartonella tribocorum TaxID=85701 RepID=A0A2M6UV48_9HYPH|nr:BafA family autotransporter [Bartonella tribocorum]PIT70062.1 autotransporter outer membrane beta-barrel domain-containing protein [Bartonella tribocorum]
MATKYKWKRNFWALMLSSCFVQAAAASERGAPFFCQSSNYENAPVFQDQYNEDMKMGRCILGASNDGIVRTRNELGFLKKPSNFTLVRDTRVFASQQEFDSSHHNNVGYNAHEQNTTFLKKPELISIKDGALLENYILDNKGTAYISNDGEIDRPGRSINNTVRNGAELYVYAGGLSEDSKIEHGGIENVQALKGKQGFSKNAVVKEGGQQSVGNGGKVEGTKIYGGEQLVFGEGDVGGEVKGSIASHTVIYGQDEILGQQKVYDGGKVWNTKVMRGGVQEIGKKSQSTKNDGFAFDTEVFGGGKQRILKGGQALGVTLNENAIQEIDTDGFVKNLTMNDETKSWVHAGATLEGKTLVNHSGQLHLYAGNDQHHTRVEDIILNGKDTKLYALTDEFDGKSSLIQKLSGEGSVIFAFTGSDPYYSQLHINNLSGNLHFAFNTTIAHNRGDYLFVEKGDGNHTISVADSGVEITEPFSNKRDLITDQSGGAHFTLTDLKGENIKAIDGGTYMYGLKERKDENGKVWFLSASRLSGPESSVTDPTNPFNPGGTATTPSTDALLTLAVVPGVIFNNELQIVRNGRKIWNRNRKDIELWTYGIKSRERIAAGHTHFKLGQTGLVLGADQLNELRHGELYIGGFGSYDQARVSHARGGDSGLSSYSIGTYATYFDHRGWYMDGVLKYNYYRDNLKAISTNGSTIQSRYNQWAIGGSFEIGCYFEPAQNTWMQPYIKLTGLQVEGKKIKLSNGMIGDLRPLISFRSEVGLTAGHEFFVNSETSLTAYIMAAWLRENINNNYVTINNQHKFITDLSGSAGKLGIGLNSVVNDKLTLYAEAHYLKGHKIKNALQGILGLRYNF